MIPRAPAPLLIMAATAAALLSLSGSTRAQSPGSQRASVAPAATGAPALLDPRSLERLLDSLVVPGLAKYHIPGLVISMIHDTDIVLAKGYGYADVEKRTPFDPDSTVIRIASVSKLVTGTAVMQLVDRGLVDMHTDVNSYLTRFKVEEFGGKPVTLHHLLTHTAGFDDRTIGKSALTQESQIPLGDFLATRLPRRICPPGEVYTYSNFSNALAGFVVEETAHEDYASYARRNIFQPLGMHHSDYRLRPDLRPLLAECYAHDGAGFRHEPFDFINDYPGGQMLSTGRDMANFMIAHLNDGKFGGRSILSHESATAMHSVQFVHQRDLPHAAGYAFGILPARSQTVLMHDGGYTGVASRLCICPEGRFGFFVACNIMDGVLVDEVSRAILDRLIPEAPEDTTKYPLAILPSYDRDVDDFAASYRYSRYSHSTIEKVGVLIGLAGPELGIGKTDEGMITMPTLWGTPRRMVQISPKKFTSIDDNYMCAFRRDSSGKVTHLFTNGTTAFEKLAWYETASFHRGLFLLCMILFAYISAVHPMIQRFRKAQVSSRWDDDPVRWLALKTSSTFLLYFLGLGIVMGFVVPREELMLGFAHGMHWAVYVVQSIAILGILLLAGLIVLLVREVISARKAEKGVRLHSVCLGVVTVVAGGLFVWFLSYWNLIGYQF
jgi:CubicO group peptidase (beta-lactamase class C family)